MMLNRHLYRKIRKCSVWYSHFYFVRGCEDNSMAGSDDTEFGTSNLDIGGGKDKYDKVRRY